MTTPPHVDHRLVPGDAAPPRRRPGAELADLGSAVLGHRPDPVPDHPHAVAFPTAKPDRPAWLGEMEDIPVIGLTTTPTSWRCASSRDRLAVQRGLHRRLGEHDHPVWRPAPRLARRSSWTGASLRHRPAEPRGVVAAAPAAAGEDMAAALTTAIGSIGDAGGAASHLCARPSVLADQRNVRDDNGQRLYPRGARRRVRAHRGRLP